MTKNPTTQTAALMPQGQTANGNILICEDDRNLAKILKKAIEEDGFCCDIAYCAAEAKTFINHKVYDAMCLDLMLPDQDGLSMLEEINTDTNFKNIPVVVVSGFADQAKSSGLVTDCIIADWINKPFDLLELQQSVSNAAGRRKKCVRILKISHEACGGEVEILREDSVCIECVKKSESIRKAISAGGFDVISVSPQLVYDPDIFACIEQSMMEHGVAMMPVVLDAGQRGSCGLENETPSGPIDSLRALLLKRLTTQANLRESA